MYRYDINVSQQGLVLLSTLIFLNMITVLVLCMLESGLLLQKTSQSFWKHHQLFLFAEHRLKIIEQNELDRFCQIPRMTNDELISKPLAWWQQNACHGVEKKINFYYVIEPILDKICIEVANTKGLPVRYWRVTLSVWNDGFRRRERLQSIVITSDNANRQCDSYQHDIELGRQTWRRLLET